MLLAKLKLAQVRIQSAQEARIKFKELEHQLQEIDEQKCNLFKEAASLKTSESMVYSTKRTLSRIEREVVVALSQVI